MSDAVSRRDLLKVAGAAGAAVTIPAAGHAQPQTPLHHHHPASSTGTVAAPAADEGVLFFFNDEEARFVRLAVERLIPEDSEGPGAGRAGVLYFIDGQLASAYGAGARMYLKGPWVPNATPQQGYQLRFSPAELYRVGIEETRAHVRGAYGGREFWDLGEPVMDDVLRGLEKGTIDLPSLPAPVFFETLLANTVEGFFADPAYGGNRDMVGWRMVGFPGAYAQFADLVDVYEHRYTREPISMANQTARRAHIAGHDHK